MILNMSTRNGISCACTILMLSIFIGGAISGIVADISMNSFSGKVKYTAPLILSVVMSIVMGVLAYWVNFETGLVQEH